MSWGYIGAAVVSVIGGYLISQNKSSGNSSSSEDVQTKQVPRMSPEQEKFFNTLITQARNRNFYETPCLATTPRPANSISGAFNALGSGPVGGSTMGSGAGNFTPNRGY